ncbi:unnamed protein product [Brassica napus]|uniref:(rape) hypothetical protein n=1 Tax=Brassica napus TaxID=3708 RepID=A0A816ZN34_BRANA|nr:unnamed protein product [Brassica napus]
MSKKPNGKAVVCSEVPIKHSGGNGVPPAKTDEVLFFRNVKFGPQEGELRFRLIHFWEAWNALTKILIGLEMLLIDEQSKIVYRVAELILTITFSWNSILSCLEDSSVRFPEYRFRFHGYEEFEAACDLKGDLYDYVGHMKLVNEQTLNDSLVLDEVEIASAATDFCEKFKAQGNTPSVILVTTVNPKRFRGALSLSSLSSSRVFFDLDVEPTRDYLTCYYRGTILLHQARRSKGTTTHIFYTFIALALVVYDISYYNYAVFGSLTHSASIINVLGDAGRELTGKQALELVESYFEANESVGDDHIIHVPQALIDTIGKTHKFIVKESNHNLTCKTQALTVTKRLEPATTDPDRQLTIKIKRINTNQTEINFSIRNLTTGNGHLTDDTTDLMEHMLSYHDIYFPVSGEIIECASHKFASMIPSLTDYAGTHVRTVLSIRDFNPKATNMIDVDVALIDLRDSIRESIPEEADKVCTICQDKFVGTGVVNSLRCNHKYHHLCIVEWIRHNLSCPTCRDTRI